MPLRRAGTVQNSSVMAGLDPAIHLEKRVFAQMMDARVKPAHDEESRINERHLSH
jgi:hypothetical protein